MCTVRCSGRRGGEGCLPRGCLPAGEVSAHGGVYVSAQGDQIQAHTQGGNLGDQVQANIQGGNSGGSGPNPPMTTAAGGTHPTGMYSC